MNLSVKCIEFSSGKAMPTEKAYNGRINEDNTKRDRTNTCRTQSLTRAKLDTCPCLLDESKESPIEGARGAADTSGRGAAGGGVGGGAVLGVASRVGLVAP